MENNNTPQEVKLPFEPNVSAALSYLISPITGIVFFLIEKDNKFVRFHAVQSVLFGLASYVAYAISSALVVVLIGILLMPLVSVAIFVLWLLLMWKAYQGQEYELPIIGKIAKKQVYK